MSKSKSRDPLAEAALEAARLQAAHRPSPKEQRLLDLLSRGSSGAQPNASAIRYSPRQQRLIAQVMAGFGMTEEEAITADTLQGHG